MSLTMCNMSRRAVYFLVMVLRVNMGSSALDYRDYRFPCGPEDCSESVTCWNDTSKRPLLNCPTSELASTFVDQLQCGGYGREGATVLQIRTRLQPSVDFNRTFHDYETGFGSDGNFWIGLDRIHRLSSRGRNLLTLELQTLAGHSVHKHYSGFWVDEASTGYTMHVGFSHQGVWGSLEPANNQPFTAPDSGTTGCANMAESGWWFPSSCSHTRINLNGRHNSTGSDKIRVQDLIVKYSLMTLKRSFIHCDMKCPNGGTCRKNRTVDSYVCDCQPPYTGRHCEVSIEDTTVATTHSTTVKAIPTTTVKAIPTTTVKAIPTTTVKAIPTTTIKAIPTTTTRGSNLSSRNVTSPTTPSPPSPPTTPSPLDVFDLFAYVVLPVFLAIVFLYAILALIAHKCVEMRKKEINPNTAEETPLVRKTKRHQKRRRHKHKVKKGNTSKSTTDSSYNS